MGVEVSGMADVFEELDDLEDDYSGPVESWVVGTPVEYAPFLEFGTSPHTIEGNPRLYFKNSEGQLISQYEVQHPGTDPQPFFRPAVNEVRLQGIDGFIRHNSRKDIEDIDSTRELISTLAFALERRIKEIIRRKGLIDTSNLINSVGAVPINDLSELRDS